jgi:hypothetical protein
MILAHHPAIVVPLQGQAVADIAGDDALPLRPFRGFDRLKSDGETLIINWYMNETAPKCIGRGRRCQL